MSDQHLVCIVRNEALLRKIIIVEPDTPVEEFYKMIAEEFAIDPGDFDVYYQKSSVMEHLDSPMEHMGQIGMNSASDARNNFVVLDSVKKNKKKRESRRDHDLKTADEDKIPPEKTNGEEDHSSDSTPTSSYDTLVESDYKFVEKGVPGYAGIKNQGSTCYLNCIIQVLYWCPEIRNTVLGWKLNEHESDKMVLKEFQKLFVQLWLSAVKSQSTNRLTKALGIRSVHMQEDAYEKFNWLLGHLETGLNEIKIKDTVSPLFTGQQESFLQCQECGTKTSKVEEFNGVMLPIRNGATQDDFMSLQQALKAYCTVETLTEDDKCLCATCGELRIMSKQLLFKKLPDILNVVLLRFQSTGGINSKLHHRVEYPKKILMNEFLSAEQEEEWYTLHSAIIHSGSADAGHYLCIVKDTDDKFTRINDQKVEWLSEEDFESTFGGYGPNGTRLCTKSAYILTYRRSESANLARIPMSIDVVTSEVRECFKEYLGEDFGVPVAYKYSKGIIYHTVKTNKLATLTDLLIAAQDSFCVCNSRILRLVWINPTDEECLEIDAQLTLIDDIIKHAPFGKIAFLLYVEGDPLREAATQEAENLKKNVVIDQPLILNHQTLATKSPHLEFMGENYFDGESVFENKLYVTVHLLNNENNRVMNSTCAFPRAKLEHIKSALLETPVAIKTANTLNDKVYEINRVLLWNQFRAMKNIETMQRNFIEETHSVTGKLDLDNVNDALHNRLPHLVWWIIQRSQNC